MKVLTVDDSPSVLKVVASVLSSADIEVDTAASPSQGLELAESNTYSLILSDYNMPEMNGVEFVKRVRLMNTHNHTPILMLTTEDGETLRQQALEAGASGWVVKPFTVSDFKKTVSRYLRDATL